MSINIKTNNFLNTSVIDLRVLLENVKKTLDNDMGIFNDDIDIIHNPNNHFPFVYFKKGVNNQTIVNLGSYNQEWNKYSYQFAHEYCHIRTNCRLGGYKYSWFEESICEVASHYALKKMAKNWKTEAPYRNWNTYSKYLLLFSQKNINKKIYNKNQFKQFLKDKIISFETFNIDHNLYRDDYKVIANKVLPYFEQDSRLWQAMTYWNKWDLDNEDTITEVFNKWLELLPDELKNSGHKLVDLFNFK